MKLISVSVSPLKSKKYRAEFDDGTHTDFGQNNAPDYTLTHDKKQREHYRTRHKKDLETNDPTRAGFLSYYILWGDSINIHTNIRAFKKKFNS